MFFIFFNNGLDTFSIQTFRGIYQRKIAEKSHLNTQMLSQTSIDLCVCHPLKTIVHIVFQFKSVCQSSSCNCMELSDFNIPIYLLRIIRIIFIIFLSSPHRKCGPSDVVEGWVMDKCYALFVLPCSYQLRGIDSVKMSELCVVKWSQTVLDELKYRFHSDKWYIIISDTFAKAHGDR